MRKIGYITDLLYTSIWAIWFWAFMTFALMVMILLSIFRVFSTHKTYEKLLTSLIRFWGKVTIYSTFSKVAVSGYENLPKEKIVCFISNHQGYLDIPLILGWLDRTAGFIAKKELLKIPVLSHWMKIIYSVFIDRSNARETIRSFDVAAESIRKGHPIIIFPEGTRSRSNKMGEFHVGSLKLAYLTQAVIVPISISGTWKVYEQNKRIRKSNLKLTFLPPIRPTDELYNKKDELVKHLYKAIDEMRY